MTHRRQQSQFVGWLPEETRVAEESADIMNIAQERGYEVRVDIKYSSKSGGGGGLSGGGGGGGLRTIGSQGDEFQGTHIRVRALQSDVGVTVDTLDFSAHDLSRDGWWRSHCSVDKLVSMGVWESKQCQLSARLEKQVQRRNFEGSKEAADTNPISNSSMRSLSTQ